MTNSLFNVTRFSFAGGRAKPVEQTLCVEGVNKYDHKQIVFAANVEGKDKPAHLFNLNIEDAQGMVDLLKAGIKEAKAALDTTPAEWRKRQLAKKATSDVQPTTMDLASIIAGLQAAGYTIAPPASSVEPTATLEPTLDELEVTTVTTAPTKPTPTVRKRGTTHTKPAAQPKATTQALDGLEGLEALDSIPTEQLDALHAILAIVKGARA